VRALSRLIGRETLAVILGVSDGTLTALTLASGRLTGQGHPIEVGLIVRIAVAATVTSAFVFFVARYTELRRSLVRAERELSMTNRLAATSLGHEVLRDAVEAAAIAALAGLPGALLPLVVGAIATTAPWLAIVVAVGALGLLGAIVARTVGGSLLRWATVMMAGGVFVSLLGAILNIA
jgi:predicted membrane protein (TIGR00267 family)